MVTGIEWWNYDVTLYKEYRIPILYYIEGFYTLCFVGETPEAS